MATSRSRMRIRMCTTNIIDMSMVPKTPRASPILIHTGTAGSGMRTRMYPMHITSIAIDRC
jgi:hypothetical protein